MKVLIDECIPRKFKKSLAGHECQTVPEAGLAGKKNGALLTSAERLRFDVLLTMDKEWSTSKTWPGEGLRWSSCEPSQIGLAICCRTRRNASRRISNVRRGQLVRIGR